MPEAEDSHDGTPEDSSDEEGGGGLVGFLFGNVDRNLQLEDNYMDSDALEHLDALGSSRLGGSLGQLQVRGISTCSSAHCARQSVLAGAQCISEADCDKSCVASRRGAVIVLCHQRN